MGSADHGVVRGPGHAVAGEGGATPCGWRSWPLRENAMAYGVWELPVTWDSAASQSVREA